MARKSTKRVANKREKISKRASSAFVLPDVNELFRRKTVSEIQARYSESLLKWTEDSLGVRLPGSYISLVKKRNGGALRRNAFKVRKRREWYSFDQIAGLDRKHVDAITSRTRVAREWQVPEGLIALDGDGHWWLCLDYRRCGPEGEPVLIHYDTDTLGSAEESFQVADSLDEFLAGLVFGVEDFVFAIDDLGFTGEQLHKALVALGCRGRYPPGATKTDRKKAPRQWRWREYKTDVGEPADILFGENGDVDPWTLARPAKHPLLHLRVGRKDQQRCVRRLAKELGDAAVLIHQPLGQPAIRGLSAAVSFKQRKRKSAGQLDSKDINSAVLAGDRALVKALLESGTKPDRRYLGPGTATGLDQAVSHGQTAILKLLLKYAKRPLDKNLLRTPCHKGHLGVIKILIDNGLKPEENHLTSAVTERHVPVVRLLLSLGIEPSHKAISRAAGIVEPSRADSLPGDVHEPILRMLKKAGAKPANARIQRLFDTL